MSMTENGISMRSLTAFAARGATAQAAADRALDEATPTKGARREVVRSKSTNPTRYINRNECRKYLLHQAETTRSHKFRRVSSETLLAINEAVRRAMADTVRRLPSKGKTI